MSYVQKRRAVKGVVRQASILLLASVVLLSVGQLAQPGTALALTNDAQRACGVDPGTVTPNGAVVPVDLQDEFFQNVPSVRDPVPIECGNGTTTGAVHIELKHNVPNWGDGVTAIVKTIDKGVPNVLKDRTEYTWNFRPGKTMRVVVGDRSLITAYPFDGLEETWIEASVAG